MSMRCFIAVELDSFIRDNLSALRKQLQTELWGYEKGIKWVKSENLHVTVKFLGDVDDNKIMDVCKGCDEAASEHSTFDIEVGNAGYFPPRASARVIWAGLTQGAEQLRNLFASVEDNMEMLGFDKENKPFSPHITLARIKNSENGRKAASIIDDLVTHPFGVQGVEALTIFSSNLTSDGPVYNVVHRAIINSN